MIKKLVLFALLLTPMFGFAQEQKIAYVKYDEIVPLMQEFTQMQDSLKKASEAYEEQLATDREEYNKKYSEFVEKQASLDKNIRERRQQDLLDMDKRIQLFQYQAQQNLQQLQEELLQPIIEKVQKVLEEVATENNYAYVLDAGVARYISPKSPNATPLVKTKLGLK